MTIEKWLHQLGLSRYIDLFLENELTYDDLSEIAADKDLIDLGIVDTEDRRKILEAILKVGSEEVQQTEIEPDITEKEIIHSYPYLIAFPFSEMINERKHLLKIQLLKDVFLNVLKYLGLITVSEYLQSPIKSKVVTRLFREKLYQPQFGHWNHFLRESIAFLQESNHRFCIPELAEVYRKIELAPDRKLYDLEMTYWDEFGEIHAQQEQVTAISGLIGFRNKYIGHSVTLSKEKSITVFQQYYPILKDLLLQLRFVTKYPILKYNNGKTWKLMGNKISSLDKIILSDNKISKLWLQLPDKRQFHLIPFFILPRQYITGVMDSVEMFIYEQYTGKRIVYFSPERETGETSGRVVDELNNLLSLKEKEPELRAHELTEDRFAKLLTEETQRVRNQLVKEKKVIPGIYQPRTETENDIRRFLKSDSSVYFLASEAGSGKTNLFHQINSELMSEKKKTLFLRGARFQTNSLRNELLLILNLQKETEIDEIKVLGRDSTDPLIIMLDGANEHQEPEELLSSCMSLLSEIPENALKIMISWRIYSRKDLPRISATDAKFFFPISGEVTIPQQDESLLVKYTHPLKRLNMRELASAWESYVNHKSKSFRPQFSLSDLEYKDRTFLEELKNPLHLRIFLHLNNNIGLKKKTRLLGIWPAWYQNLKQKIKDFENFINGFVRIIYKTENTIPELDFLYDQETGKYIRDLNIDSPYQQLLLKGVITQFFHNDLPVVTFTIESAWHYILAKYISSIPGMEKAEFLRELLEQKKGLKGFYEAVALILREEVVRGEFRRLHELIMVIDRMLFNYIKILGQDQMQQKYEIVKVTIPALLYMIEFTEFKSELDQMLKNEPYNLIWPLMEVNNILAEKLKYGKQFELLNYIYESDYYSTLSDDFKFHVLNNLGVCAYRKDDHKTALNFFEKTIEQIDALLQNKNQDEDYLLSTKFMLINNSTIALSKLSRFEEALILGNKLLTTVKKTYGENDLRVIKYYDTLAAIYCEAQKFTKGEEHLLQALELREKYDGPNHPDTARAYYNLGNTYLQTKENEKAEKYLLKSIAAFEKSFGYNHPIIAHAYSSMGTLRKNLADFKEAEKYSRKSIEIYEKIYGKEYSSISIPLNNLAIICRKQKRFDDAEKYYLRALELINKKRGENSIKAAKILLNLGSLHYDAENYQKAEAYLSQSLEIRLNQKLTDNEGFADNLHYLGNVYYLKDNYEKALQLHNKALKLKGKIHGKNHAKTMTCYHQIGLDYYHSKQYRESIPMFEQAIEISKKFQGINNPTVFPLLKLVSDALYRSGQYQKAEKSYAEQLNYYQEKDQDYFRTLKSLADSIFYSGKAQESKSLYEKVLDYRIQTGDKKSKTYSALLNQLCLIHFYANEYDKAESYQMQLIEIALETYGRDHPNLGYSYNILGLIRMNLGKNREAEKNFLESIAIREKAFGKPHPETAVSHENLAINHTRMKEFKNAIESYNKAILIREKVCKENHPQLAADHAELAHLYLNIKDFKKAFQSGSLSFKMMKSIYGENDLRTANSALNTSSALIELNRAEEAETFALAAQKGYETIQNPNTRFTYMNLARIYRILGNDKKAEVFEKMTKQNTK